MFLSLIGCNKLIESTESDLIAGATALSTVPNCESAILGAYSDFAQEMDILLNATISDEVKTAGEFYNAATTHEWLFTPVDVGIRDNFTAITPQYRTIDRANRVLAALPTAIAANPAQEALKLRLRGEALFLRAFCHFQIYRYYCAKFTPGGLAMPYLDRVTLEPMARINMQTYFDKMNADITAAKPLLPATIADINRANIVSANGLHARIALYSNDWANAETFSTDYINALPLVSRTQFPGIWADAITNEVAYRVIRIATTSRVGSLFRGTSASPTQIGTIVWIASNKLWDSYNQATDIRFSSYLKAEPLLAVRLGVNNQLVRKYEGTAYGTANENVANLKIMRTGEMFLIRAEARAELGRFTGANSAELDLNQLRAARISGYINVTLASASDAITQIMQERFKELAFEGHRFWDLKRRGLPVSRLVADAISPGASTLPANDYRFLLPIPLTEMQANSAMQQNPGYN